LLSFGLSEMPRRKKVVVVSSEEDDFPATPAKKAGNTTIEAAFARAGSTIQSPSPARTKQLPTRLVSSPAKKKPKTSAASSPSPSPAKLKSKDKSIYSFFNAATQKQQTRPSASPEKPASESLDLDEDAIQDSSDDSIKKSLRAKPKRESDGKKRKYEAIDTISKQTEPLPSLKFLKPKPSKAFDESNSFLSRPWTDQFAPSNLEELAVHKKKVQDVRDYIVQSVTGKSRFRLIVLKGGAGTGKTTTVRLLAENLGLQVIEWHNPDSTRGQEGGSSITSQFEEFINRSSSFGTLDFGQGTSDISNEPESRNSIVLVEEFPNTFSRSSSTLTGFRRALLQYLALSTPSPDEFFMQKSKISSNVPIVMVISESLLTTSTASSDSFTAHRLLGPDIVSHPGTAVIEFNPIAPTFMSKALDIIIKKEARLSGRKVVPGSAVLKHLSETGDIRSAISSLEFFCLHEGSDHDWSGKVNFTKQKKNGIDQPITSMEKQSLQMITQRENTLGIFHAVGRVLHNHRSLPLSTDVPPVQPAYYPQFQRPKVSEVNVEDLLNELGTDIGIFIAGIHENYVLSCQGLDEEETLDAINGCIDSMSDADLLCPDRYGHDSSRSTWQATSNDALRQDAISFATSVQGCLLHLPHPVKRVPPPQDYMLSRGKNLGKTSAFQMFYPVSQRLWRKKEQIEEYMEQINSKIRNGDQDGSSKPRKSNSKAGTVETWKSSSFTSNNPQHNDDEISASNGILRGINKAELLLERLPAIEYLQRRKPVSQRLPFHQIVHKVVHLGGLSTSLAPEGDDGEQEENPNSDVWATDKPSDELSHQKWRLTSGVVSKTNEASFTIKQDIEKLVLSDDDIVDDSD
jgi:cell cycle checkpoint protein